MAINSLSDYQALRVRYRNKGQTGCATVTIKSVHSNEIVRMRYDPRHRDALEQACQYLKDKGFNLIGVSYVKDTSDYIIFSDTFESIRG